MEEAKKMRCYKRVIYKQFSKSQIFVGHSFSPSLYGDAILVDSFGPQIWPPEINKNIWSSFFLLAISELRRELGRVSNLN